MKLKQANYCRGNLFWISKSILSLYQWGDVVCRDGCCLSRESMRPIYFTYICVYIYSLILSPIMTIMSHWTIASAWKPDAYLSSSVHANCWSIIGHTATLLWSRHRAQPSSQLSCTRPNLVQYLGYMHATFPLWPTCCAVSPVLDVVTYLL